MTLPGNLTAITVHGTYVDLDGSAASGTVTFTANVVGNIVDTNTGTIIAPTSSPVTLDHTGSFSITLPASDDPALVPNGFSYLVTENLTSGQRSYSILLPTGTSPVNVAAIAPAPPANAHVTPVEPVNPVRPEDTGTITSLASGTVTSVNGKTGDVVLGASDVGA
ncbi:MAG: hypothetical protein J2O49_04525, partial [Sciscionella sp.]|nr:hypothetical protein [Sciscionella sp.]